MNRPTRSHAISPARPQVPSSMLRSRSNNLLPRESGMPPTTVLIPFQDFSKPRVRDSDHRTKSELPPTKIGKSMLLKTSTNPGLPGIASEANLPKYQGENSILKPQYAKYQFKTPPRSRKRAGALSASVPDVIALIRNPPKLHDSFLRQKLPKIDFPGKGQDKNASFEKKGGKGSETEPVTSRKDETPERMLTTKLRPVKANHSVQLADDGSLPAVVDVFRMRTRTGVMYGKPKRHNQDACLALQDFASTKNQFFFAVFDGHGGLGHEVSAFVKRVLPLYIDSELPRSRKTYTVRTHFHTLSAEDQLRVRAALTQAHLAAAEDLALQQIIDVSFSGTTAVSVLLRGRSVMCSNVGDSRAVVGRLTPDGWMAIPLSNDHKPNDPEEQRRIERSGGRVEPYTGVRSM